MIKTIRSVNNQTMPDLALQVYGGLDNLIRLCTDNGIKDVNFVNTTPLTYSYDTDLVQNQQNTINVYPPGKVYATGGSTTVLSPRVGGLMTEDRTGYLLTEDRTGYLIAD